jgi:hypothetical protein
MTEKSMPQPTGEFIRLEQRLAQARRAWKRTAALSGLVVAVSEVLGIVALAVLADMLFALDRPGRLVLLALVGAATLFLVARHILAPLLRKVTDAQLALYLEEHNPGFEGALIAAVEFGPSQELTPRQAQIIQGIIHEAVERAEHFDLRQALDLGRFRKYGVLAAGLVAAYLILGAVLPESVGRHMARVVAPWKTTPEEIEALWQAAELKKPIAITLSRATTSLLRGSAFELEATLSRKPQAPVQFHFRAFDPKGKAATWKELPLKPVERLNGYQFALPDVNEDLEFFVATGEFKSPTHRITVYDPLILLNSRLTIHPPAYLKRPDETVAEAAAPDVQALVGASVTVALETNRPLKEGQALWQDGTTTAFTPDPANPQAALIRFEVKADTAYTYTLVDVDGQRLHSPGPVAVRAIADKPPTIKLLTPEPMLTTHPLGEIAFTAELADDFGIAGAELLFTRGLDPKAGETRLPLPIAKDQGETVLRLETLAPTVQPGDLLICYLECRDLKGQKAVTDLVLVTVGPFDPWTTWAPPHLGAGSAETVKLEAILKAAWTIHAQKDYLPPNDFNTQAEELAATMLDPETKELLPFVHNMDELSREPLAHAQNAVTLIERGHKDLTTHATDRAIGDFRAALSELALAGLLEVKPLAAGAGGSSAAAKKQAQMQMLASTAATAPPPAAAQDPGAAPQASMAQAETAKEQAEKAAKLMDAQRALVAKMKDAAQPGAGVAAGAAQAPGAAKGTAAQAAAAAKGAAQANAAAQKALAAQAKAMADALKGNAASASSGEKMAQAARNMFESGAALEKQELEKGTQKAEIALRDLAALVIELKAGSQDELGRLLDNAERTAQRLMREQAAARAKAEALAAELRGRAPDAVQERSLKALAAQQARLNADIAPFAKLLGQLRDAAAGGLIKPEMAKQLAEASLQMNRARVPQKAANAAIELVAGHPENAAPEQRKAEAGLAKVLEAIRVANDARATGYEAELKRAKGEADRIQEAIARLATAPAAERAAAAAQAVDEAQRLARHLKLRDLTKGDPEAEQDAKRLDGLMTTPATIQRQLEEAAKGTEFVQLTARLQNRLEAAYQAMLAAKNLAAAQREECPPQYRQLVNQYFEALSTPK